MNVPTIKIPQYADNPKNNPVFNLFFKILFGIFLIKSVI